MTTRLDGGHVCTVITKLVGEPLPIGTARFFIKLFWLKIDITNMWWEVQNRYYQHVVRIRNVNFVNKFVCKKLHYVSQVLIYVCSLVNNSFNKRNVCNLLEIMIVFENIFYPVHENHIWILTCKCYHCSSICVKR